jgi:D-alanyl-D-alanine carboxypeptidase
LPTARLHRQLLVLLILIALLLGVTSGVSAVSTTGSLTTSLSGAAPSATIAPATTQSANPAAGPTVLLDPSASSRFEINGKAYVLYDAQSGTFLLGNNPDQPLAPASITKVMTVLLALENLQLADNVTITKDMYDTIPNDYVRLGLVEGETIRVEELLYACLLISANDAAMALAIQMGGTMAGFTAMMNKRATALGCTATHFTNPYGLAEDGHLTTAHDMALIMAAALQFDQYTQIAMTKNHLIPATNLAGPRGMTNGNRFVSTEQYAYAYYVGGKTGYTIPSGHTIAAGARKDGRTLIGVILGATASEPRYVNLAALFDYGFTTYGNIPVDPNAFAAAEEQALAQLRAKIKEAGAGYEVATVKAALAPYLTTTNSRCQEAVTGAIGDVPAVIQAGQSSQVIALPMLLAFPDGVRKPVGTLRVTLQVPPTVKPTSPGGSDHETGSQKPSLATILLWIGMALLAGILIFALVIVILLRREIKRRRQRRRRPQIRRL